MTSLNDYTNVSVSSFNSFISGQGYRREVYFENEYEVYLRYYDDASNRLMAMITLFKDNRVSTCHVLRDEFNETTNKDLASDR